MISAVSAPGCLHLGLDRLLTKAGYWTVASIGWLVLAVLFTHDPLRELHLMRGHR